MTRPGIDQLLDNMRAGKLDRVVVWRLDRLGRTTRGLCELFDELRERLVRRIDVDAEHYKPEAKPAHQPQDDSLQSHAESGGLVWADLLTIGLLLDAVRKPGAGFDRGPAYRRGKIALFPGAGRCYAGARPCGLTAYFPDEGPG